MKNYFGLLLLLLFQSLTHAQTAKSLQECESEFLKNNLFLLAEQYNIDAAEALIVQSRIWENPLLTAELNAYNPDSNQYFDNGKNGQKAFGIEQIIYLGGKKRNEKRLYQTEKSIAILAFDDLLRTLKYELRFNFFEIYYNQQKIEATDKQIEHIQELISSYSIQVKNGNIPLSDLVRLQSLFVNFKNERIEFLNNSIDAQTTLKLLLSQKEDIIPDFNDISFEKYTKPFTDTLEILEKQALNSRPDYLSKQKEIEAQQFNLKWQKSLSIPDLTIGANYDQQSGAFNNEANLTIAIPLPLWNSNKGNIQHAKVMIEQSKAFNNQSALQISTEVSAAYEKWNMARNNYVELYPAIGQDFQIVYEGILNNFRKRNISLMEFTDFMESYNQANIQLNELKKNVVHSAEQLNTTINKDLF